MTSEPASADRGDGTSPLPSTLVTGSAGFIGSHVCDRLLADGHEVWGIDNLDVFYEPSRKRANMAEALRKPGMHFVEGTIQDEILLDGLMSDVQFDAVIHLAALPGLQACLENPELCYEINVMGTLRLLEAMQRHSIPVLLLGSSAAVYGDGADAPHSEAAPADEPTSPFSASKRSAEMLGHTYRRLHGLTVYCLRLSTVFGPRQRPDQEIHTFARLMASRQPLPTLRDATSRRDCTYVDDVVDGIVRALRHARETSRRGPAFEIFNLGRGETIDRDELVDDLATLLGAEPEFDQVSDPPVEVLDVHGSIDRARDVLGWEPSTSLQVGLRSFVEWFQEEPSPSGGAVRRGVVEPSVTS